MALLGVSATIPIAFACYVAARQSFATASVFSGFFDPTHYMPNHALYRGMMGLACLLPESACPGDFSGALKPAQDGWRPHPEKALSQPALST